MDEMSIRQHVQYIHSNKYFSGYANLITLLEEDEPLPVATHAIVVMVNGINVQLTIPIAHYFITALCAEEKAILLTSILKTLSDIGVKVLTITADGLSSNAAAVDILGASFEKDNIKPYFKNPYGESNVYYFFDAPHMLKLVRNSWGDVKTFRDKNGRKIEWKFIERLYRSTSNDMTSHKLTKKHIEWRSMKMKVYLATQTLSNSVAESIEKLSGTRQFMDSDGTAEFVGRFNKLFDIFNSDKHVEGNIFKSPINVNSKAEIFDFLDDMIDYIKHLTWNGQPLMHSIKYVPYRGFISNIIALKLIYEEEVETGAMSDFKTSKVQQDVLESLFSRMRKNGSNDNPTVEQFNANFHKTLINKELTSSTFANCIDDLDILTVSCEDSKYHQVPRNYIMVSNIRTDETETEEQEDPETEDVGLEEHNEERLEPNPEQILEPSVDSLGIANVAGLIEATIEKNHRFNCVDCANVFEVNEKVDPSIFVKNSKNVRPCTSTFNICNIAKDLVSKYFISVHESRFEYDGLFASIGNHIAPEMYYTSSDFTHEDGENHRKFIINFVIEEYIRIRCVNRARNITLGLYTSFVRAENNRDTKIAGQ